MKARPFLLISVLFCAISNAQNGFRTFYNSGVFVVPPSVNSVTIEALGSGGYGAGMGGGGGGGGGFAKGIYAVTPGDSFYVQVDYVASAVAPFVQATGGSNGKAGNSSYFGQGGQGGSGTGGNLINCNGGNGGSGCPNYYGGGGGGAGGVNGNGANGANAASFDPNNAFAPQAQGGAGGGGVSGKGGNGATTVAQGIHGGSYGAGGGGGSGSQQGGACPGYCHITWGACESPVAPVWRWEKSKGCAGQAVELEALGYDTIQWSFDTLFTTVFAKGPVVSTPPLFNDTTVFLRSGGCPLSAHSTAWVSIYPAVSLSAVVSPTTLCYGQSCLITCSGASYYEFHLWPDGHPESHYSSRGVSTHTTVYIRDTVLSFPVVGMDWMGLCPDTLRLQVSLKAKPDYSCTATSTNVCLGQAVSVTAGGPAITSFTWSTGTHQPTLQLLPLGDTLLKVTMSATDGCVYRDSVQLVNKTPTLQIYADKEVLCRGDSASLVALGANGFTWSTGQAGSYALVAPHQSTTYTAYGQVNGCVSQATISIVVNDCVTSLETMRNSGWGVYPNPSSGEVFIGSRHPGTAELFDSNGSRLAAFSFAETNGSAQIILEPGVYLLVSNQGPSQKIVVIR